MRFFARTIQRKLMLLMLVVGFIPAAAGVAYIYWGSVVSIDTAVGEYLQDRADAAASTIDQSLQVYFDATMDWSERITGELPETDDPAPFDSVLLVDVAGQTISAVGPDPPQEASVPSAFQRPAAESLVFLDEVKSATGGTILKFVRQVSSNPDRFCVCLVAAGRFLEFLPPVNAGGRPVVDVFTNRGSFITGSSPDQRLLEFATSGYSRIRDQITGWSKAGAKNDALLIGYSTSKLLRMKQNEGATSVDWTAMVHMELDDLSQFVAVFLWRYFFFSIAVAIVLILLSYSVSRVFLRPIRTLHREVNQIAAGQLGGRLRLQTNDEFSDLAEAFNTMEERLVESRARLELQVKTVQSKAGQIELVNEMTRAIIAAFDVVQLVEAFDVKLRALVRYDGLSAVLFTGSRGCEVITAGAPVLQNELADGVRAHLQERLLGSMGTPLVEAPATPEDEQFYIPGLTHVCAAPLQIERGLIGVLLLGSRDPVIFSPDELAVIAQVAPVFALATEHIELYDRMRHFARELELKVAERTGELRRAHDRLMQTEKFAATGRLAANIAHEINNPLGIIKNYLRLLRDKLGSQQGSAGEELQIIGEELDRIARIVRSLLEFYRPVQRISNVDINSEIRSLLMLATPALEKKDVRVETDLDDALPRQHLSQDHLRQVLLNLLRNAEDAMPSGGTLTIRTRHEVKNEDEEAIVLAVKDTGTGIAPEDLPHVFEPFFTTKSSQGTGLGLAVAYGVISSLGGTIDIETATEQGTTFTVRIPMRSPAATPAA
jgi:signal transduction histidine kinase